MNRSAALVFAFAVAALTASSGQAAEGPASFAADELSELLARVGERVRSYYDRILTMTCTEAVTQQELRADQLPRGRPRQFVYDLIVTREARGAEDESGSVKTERQLRLLNGKAVTNRYRPACTDPQPAYTDPLVFLLPGNRPGYRFTLGGRRNSTAPIEIDFAQTEPEPTEIDWKGTCFTANGGRSKGRIWIDPASGDVLRLETHLAEPFRLPVSQTLTGRGRQFMTLERQDITVRFTRVAFQEPEETLLLPDSIVTVTTIIGAGMPRMRTEQAFTNYRRFMTDARVR